MRLLLWIALALAAGLIWFLRSRVPFEPDGAGSSPIDTEVPAGSHAELMGLSREQLYERARRLDVPGRSRMGKQALIRAIAAREAKRRRPSQQH